MEIDSSLPFQLTSLDVITRLFTLPAPPNSSLSLLRTSLNLPWKGTPTRYSSLTTGAKLHTTSNVSSGFSDFLMKEIILFSASKWSIHSNPSQL